MFTNPFSYNYFPGYQKETLEYYYDPFFAECRAYSCKDKPALLHPSAMVGH